MKEEDTNMPDQKQMSPDDTQLRRRALSRWENEGGAAFYDAQMHALSHPELARPTGATEEAALRERVVALENLVIAFLAGANFSVLISVSSL